MIETIENITSAQEDRRLIKCVVWDLDNTIWNGVLLEDDRVTLRNKVANIVETLDSRGILQSIASKNDYALSMVQLKDLGLSDFFIYPQIGWSSKAASIQTIARSINIGLDSIAFLDDQPFEREEVNFSLPEVLSLDSRDLDGLLEMPEMNPRFVTEDSKMRRSLYLRDQQRKKAEDEFTGTKEEFLASLQMVFTISSATEEDLKRAEELTVRTNQLNATGYTYSYDELSHFCQSARHKLLIGSLSDKYGSYGTIALALVECLEEFWNIKLLLVSCRVMSRGVGTILLNHIISESSKHKVALRAEFVPTDRNRMMRLTYQFAGFTEVGKIGEVIILENDLTRVPGFPDYVKINILA